MSPRVDRMARAVRAALPYVLPALLLDLLFVRELLRATGGVPCPILDDVFIHFQYARSLAHLHPFVYQPGDAPTTGATSQLYVVLLAVGWLLGFHGMALSVFANIIAVAALSVLLYAAKRLGDALVGPPGGVVAAFAAIACPAFDFLSVGGMEVGVAGAAHVAAIAAAALWITAERRGVERTVKGAWLVTLVGAAAALARPEAAAGACAVALALVIYPARSRPSTRWLALVALLPATIPGLVALATTGEPTTTGMLLKWVPAKPYLTRAEKVATVHRHWHELWTGMFAGRPVHRIVPWPALSDMFRWLVIGGLVVLPISLVRRYGWPGVVLVAVLLGGVAPVAFPATYIYVGNIGRYVFTFVPLPMIVAALAGVQIGRFAHRRLKAPRAMPAVVGGVVAALFVASPRAALKEPVKAATQILAQQVRMARRVRKLPRDAVVAVNDAGAIAYLGGHRTWDMVGLTSPRAVRAYIAGVGSVFERMERLPKDRRPTYLAYYPAWFPGLNIGGKLLFAAETGGIYVGSWRKELRPIRTELFNSGARPVLVHPPGRLVDELDVADIASERSHDYFMPGWSPKSTVFRAYRVKGRTVADGGRVLGGEDGWKFKAEPGKTASWVMRTDAYFDTRVALEWNGTVLQVLPVTEAHHWVELVVHVPAARVQRVNIVKRRLVGSHNMGVFHDWLYQ